MTEAPTGARADWEDRIALRRDHTSTDLPQLPAPGDLHARPGRGQVTLDWTPVPGAIGYQVLRGEVGAPTPAVLDHHGRDVLAVPHPPYADTTGIPGHAYEYSVRAMADVHAPGSMSDAVTAAAATADTADTADTAGTATIDCTVDASISHGTLIRPWTMIGSEHLSHLLSTERTGGRPIGAELTDALIRTRDELGVRSVRAHGILCDDLGVYQEIDGRPSYDFSGVDAVFDRLLGLRLRPVVELSFMPAALAADPSRTVFEYRAVISPPKDWDAWSALIEAFVGHLIERYGIAEVLRWPFEVWNEANLEVFWSGTKAEFFRLYDLTALAVRRVHPDLRVGGPSSAAAGWVGELLEHVARSGAPLDFVSTHTYGSPPLDLRALCDRFGRPGLPILWTEWGVSPTHFHPVNDSVFSAAFLLRGMRSAAGRVDALAYWVASDHFEELGRPPELLHGGFGLLTVGNLGKPRFWALALANRLGDTELPVRLIGDGADSLVQAWAARDDQGRIGLLIWNGTLDQSKADGDPVLSRTVRLRMRGLAGTGCTVRHWRIDREHGDLAGLWQQIGGSGWPDDDQWQRLQASDGVREYRPAQHLPVSESIVALDFDLPMPGVSYLEVLPEPEPEQT